MKVIFVKLQSDQNSVLQELFTELLANILMNMSLFYHFRIFPIVNFI